MLSVSTPVGPVSRVWLVYLQVVYVDSGADHEGAAATGISGVSVSRGVCAALPEDWRCHAPVDRGRCS